jgi:hypothetical protein
MTIDRRELVERVTKELADKGKLIEAGWVGYEKLVLPPTAPQIQIDECRTAFFAGAQHLFGSIVSMLDQSNPDKDPTTADLRKMDLIHAELQSFAATFMAKLKTRQ